MTQQEIQELNDYTANRFVKQEDTAQDDSFLLQWQEWLSDGSAPSEILNTHLCRKLPVNFAAPEKISIEIHDSPAGNVPVVVFGDASDFEDFITNLIYKGTRPDNLQQMGASFIYGKVQRFLVLSRKYYSNATPEYMNLSPEDWREKSMIIRREHELTHYYTKSFYGSATNNLHDELIADFMGLYSAFGHYSGEVFRHFMGLDGTGEGRLSLYTSGLSQNVREAVRELAFRCSEWLEGWQMTQEFGRMDGKERIDFLCELGIVGMSSTN